jgi:hypothetical protein
MSKANPMTQVCIHEAGHAVMMHMCGMKVKSIRVNRKNVESQNGSQGTCMPVPKEIGLVDFAKITVAGSVAESIAFGGCPIRKLNQVTDSEELEDIMFISGVAAKARPKEKRRIIGLVAKSLSKHMDQVMTIAQELDNNGKINGKVVEQIMKR